MKGWSKKRLVEITEKIGSGATPRGGNDAYKESGISLFRSLNVHDGFFSLKNLAFIDENQANKLSNVQVQEGDVLLNITGASIARCCIAPSELLPARVNQHVAIIRPKLNYVDTNFLAYLFISKEYKDALLNTGEKAGATRQALTKTQLQEFEINIPPLSEQKRIVSIVDETFEAIDIAIDNTKQNLTNARELFDSSLQFIFSNEGKDWPRLKLSDLLDCKWITSHLDGNHGGDYPKKDEFVTSGIPYISANCLKNENVDISLAKYLSPERAASLRKGIAQNNDVLFAHNATVGPVAVLYTNENKIILSTSLTYYRCDTQYIIPEYLALYMRSNEFKSQYKAVMGQSTRNQVPITMQRTFYHIIPPVKKQQNIANHLDDLFVETQRLEAIYRQKLIALNELKQSILHKAFTGELTADKADLKMKIEQEAIAV